MLVGNGIRAGGNPCRFLGGISTAHQVERSSYNQHGAVRCSLSGQGSNAEMRTAGYPNGYEDGGAWCLPRKGGGLASHNRISGAGDLSAVIQAARNLEAALSGSGDLSNAELSLIVSLAAALSGSGDLTAAASGSVSMEATLAGLGDIIAALGAIISMDATLTGSGTLDGSNLTGLASLSAALVSFGELTPEGLASAVWSAAAANNNATGSMGEKLNDAGSGTNPWTEVITSGYTAAQILRILAAVAAGKTNIIDLGGGAATVEIRDLGDTKNVVVAGMTGSERSTVTLDGT